MSATFPASLPKCLVEGLGYEASDRTARTQMESGRIRMRRRHRNPPVVYSVAWDLSLAQFRAFEAFHDLAIGYGSEEFSITLPVGAGSESITARFSEPYQASLVDPNNWRVTASLLVTGRTISANIGLENGTDSLVTEAGDNLVIQ